MFRQIRSLFFDPTYAQAIYTRSFGQSLKFWLKIAALVYGIYAILSLATAVYLAPQLSNLINTKLPSFSLTLSSGQLSTSNSMPLIINPANPTIIVDTTSQITNLDAYEYGYLLTQSQIIIKSPDGNILSEPYPQNLNYIFDTRQVSTWLSSHQPQVVLILGLVSILATLWIAIIQSATQLITSLAASTLLTLVARFFSRRIPLILGIKIGIHALVPVLIISTITLSSLSQGIFSWLTNIAVYLYFFFTWTKSLPLQSTKT
jgi:hypothetical protein